MLKKGWRSKCNKYPGLDPGMEKGQWKNEQKPNKVGSNVSMLIS